MAGKPRAEIEISDALVRDLLAHQHPDVSHLPLLPLTSGWDNVIYRLGRNLLVRLPRREVAAQLVLNEQRWLPRLVRRLPIAIPAPLRVGVPSADYPWHWSILPWFEGTCADEVPPARGQVDVLAEFLKKLHTAAPADAPRNPVRGVPLQVRADATHERMARLKRTTDLISPTIEGVWQRGLSATPATDARWLHGDLHAQNVLVNNGRLSAIIDWGDITAGDVATDLPVVWGLFANSRDRRRLLDLYAPDQPTYERALGWAVMFGVVLTDSGLINSPRHARQGQTLLARLVEDA